jgi:hypothetical protein
MDKAATRCTCRTLSWAEPVSSILSIESFDEVSDEFSSNGFPQKVD